MIRRVYTDGRKHSEDTEPSYAGESIGHWESQTLVIDTTAIAPKSEFPNRLKTSGKTHVIERITLQDATHLRVEIEIGDPIALTKPWRYSVVYQKSDTDFVESYNCDNDRDSRGEPDLRPPVASELK